MALVVRLRTVVAIIIIIIVIMTVAVAATGVIVMRALDVVELNMGFALAVHADDPVARHHQRNRQHARQPQEQLPPRRGQYGCRMSALHGLGLCREGPERSSGRTSHRGMGAIDASKGSGGGALALPSGLPGFHADHVIEQGGLPLVDPIVVVAVVVQQDDLGTLLR